jgi:hypothetical protein
MHPYYNKHNTYECYSSGWYDTFNQVFIFGVWTVGSMFTPGYFTKHARLSSMAVDSQTRLPELISRTCSMLGPGEARSTLKNSLDINMT